MKGTTKKIKKHLKKRTVLTIAATIFVGVVATVFVMVNNYYSMLEKYSKEMTSSLNATVAEYSKNQEMDAAYADAMNEMASSIVGYAAFYWDEHGYNEYTRAQIIKQIGEYVFLHCYSGEYNELEDVEKGHLLQDRRNNCALTKDELFELLNTGSISVNGRHYNACRINGNRIAIIDWQADDIFTRKSIMAAYSASRYQYVYCVNKETGIIEDSSEADEIGTEYTAEIEGGTITYFGNDAYTIVDIEGKGKCLLKTIEGPEGKDIFAYVPLKELGYKFLSRNVLPLALLWAFFLLIMVYFVRFSVEKNADNETEYVHIWGKLYADNRLASHSMGLVLFASIITILSVAYYQTLLNYSAQDTDAYSNLECFESFLNNANENATIMKDDFRDMQLILSECVSDYYLKYPGELSEESLDRMQMYMAGGITGISIYDYAGNLEYDTDGNAGHTMSKEGVRESGTRQDVWSVIEGIADSTGYYDPTTGLHNAVIMRQDKNGAVSVRSHYDDVHEVLQLMQPEETLKTADFGAAERMLIQKDAPEDLYYIISGTDNVETVENVLPEELCADGFSGVKTAQGKRYFLNTRANDTYVMISAIRTSLLHGIYNASMLLTLLVAFVLLEVVLLGVSLHTLNEAPEKVLELSDNSLLADTLSSQAMDSRFRGTLRNMSIITAVFITFQLLVDSIKSDEPVIEYLFSSHWPKGINMFSITMIIIVLTVGVFGGYIVEKVLIFLTRSMGPRGLTIGRMVCSLIRFLVLVTVLAMSIRQIGFEMSTVLAGAGIVGGLAMFCAQATVNDMISGFLLVFEKQFNIGDWITIDDFRGKVVEIGIRTTKLQKQETYKVFNNSEIRKFKIAEPWDRGAMVNIDIAYKEDATKVIKLLKDSTEIYRKEIPYITKGPHIVGVEELGDSGITIGIRAIADVEKVITTEREIRRVTKMIFDENGIEIPFNQVKLHMDSSAVAGIKELTNHPEEK